MHGLPTRKVSWEKLTMQWMRDNRDTLSAIFLFFSVKIFNTNSISNCHFHLWYKVYDQHKSVTVCFLKGLSNKQGQDRCKVYLHTLFYSSDLSISKKLNTEYLGLNHSSVSLNSNPESSPELSVSIQTVMVLVREVRLVTTGGGLGEGTRLMPLIAPPLGPGCRIWEELFLCRGYMIRISATWDLLL